MRAKLWGILFCCLFCSQYLFSLPMLDIKPSSLSVMSLNLHAYHPMGAAPRYYESKEGEVERAPAHLFYFSWEEIKKGHAARIGKLTSDLQKHPIDLLFLQEVVAGGPETPKNCHQFQNDNPSEKSTLNSALQLQQSLADKGLTYQPLLACRGNTGWITNPHTYRDRRIVTLKNGIKEVVFDFAENPYPDGIVIEGFGMLVGKKWRVLEHQALNISYNSKGHSLFIQTAAISLNSPSNSPWYLIINLHAGHKFNHFEQAIAIRKHALSYSQKASFNKTFGGTLVAGDFNAQLYRPRERSSFDEVSTIPWEMRVSPHFDYTYPALIHSSKQRELARLLYRLNFSSHYKPWATIKDKEEFNRRLSESIANLLSFQKNFYRIYGHSPLMQESVYQASHQEKCRPFNYLPGSCEIDERIDFIFSDTLWTLENSFIIYPENEWNSTKTVTDHPGVFARFLLP